MLTLNMFTPACASQTGPNVGQSIYGDHTVEADADTAKQSPRCLKITGGSPRSDVVGEQNPSDRLAANTTVGAAIEVDLDLGGRKWLDGVALRGDAARAHAASRRCGARLARLNANGAVSVGAAV